MIAPIQIRREDVNHNIRKLAAVTGLSITDAIQKAVNAQLAIELAKAAERALSRREEAQRVLSELRNLPVVGPALDDGDIYGADGLPK